MEINLKVEKPKKKNVGLGSRKSHKWSQVDDCYQTEAMNRIVSKCDQHFFWLASSRYGGTDKK